MERKRALRCGTLGQYAAGEIPIHVIAPSDCTEAIHLLAVTVKRCDLLALYAWCAVHAVSGAPRRQA